MDSRGSRSQLCCSSTMLPRYRRRDCTQVQELQPRAARPVPHSEAGFRLQKLDPEEADTRLRGLARQRRHAARRKWIGFHETAGACESVHGHGSRLQS
jgi:hypothetical protein